MKKNIIYRNACIFLTSLCCLHFFSCKGTPKREMEITIVKDSATETLENANSFILSGDYEKAENFLDRAYSQAMTIDNYDLLTSISLAYVSLYLSTNKTFSEENSNSNIYTHLEKAKTFAQFASNPDLQKAMCTLSEIRINLSQEQTKDFNNLINLLKEHETFVKKDDYCSAQFEATYGDIYRKQKNYEMAINSYEKAAKLFTDKRYLSEIGITWYKLAQVNSLSGKKKAALDAIEQAIKYDRAAENTLALGTDYYGKGLILLKNSPSKEEKNDARYCFLHSADIFNAAGNDMEEMAARSILAAESINE